MKIEDIEQECKDYQAELETLIPDDINACIERMTNLAVYHSRIGYLLALSKLNCNIEKRSKIVAEVIEPLIQQIKLSASAQKVIVDGIACKEQFMVDWLDRLNSMCVHQIDICRSIISKGKEEMKISSFVQNSAVV